MGAIEDFWNEMALQQIGSGGAPSVITDEMRKVLDGDEEAMKEMNKEINIEAAVLKGMLKKRI